MPVAVDNMYSTESVDSVPDTAAAYIFQTVVPRRKIDKFGRDRTSRSDFVLSATVFPTAVRAPALEELQQRCGHVSRTDSIGHISRTDSLGQRCAQISRTDSLGVRSRLTDDTLPGSGPKVLTLRKNKPSRYDMSTPRSGQTMRSSRESLSSKSHCWTPRGGKKDIRDPMYMNTFCSGERRLRFKESSLPRIAKNRPWSVGESNPTKRFVKISHEVRKSSGQITPRTRIQGTPIQIQTKPLEDESFQEGEKYFEVKRMSADIRSRSRGEDYCLYSQVKQSIKLAKGHDPRKGREVERPMKSEVGRYRPFSTTRIRTPCPSPTPSVLVFKEQDSADTYKQYMMTKQMQTRASIAMSARTVVSGVAARNNTAASTYLDSESQILQSVADSNAPELYQKAPSEASQLTDFSNTLTSDTINLGLELRGAAMSTKSAVTTKSGKSRFADADSEKAPTVYSPKKEVLIPRRKDHTVKSSGKSTQEEVSGKSSKEMVSGMYRGVSGRSGDSEAGMSIKEVVVPRKYSRDPNSRPPPVPPSSTPEPEVAPVQLDDNGDPLIWQHAPITSSTPDPTVIKIPAVGISMLSIDDTEDTDTCDEG